MSRDLQALPARPAHHGADERQAPLDGDDFYCLRFSTWYRSFDCAFRTRYRTCDSCSDCDQGRFNLKRHAAALVDRRCAVRCLGG